MALSTIQGLDCLNNTKNWGPTINCHFLVHLYMCKLSPELKDTPFKVKPSKLRRCLNRLKHTSQPIFSAQQRPEYLLELRSPRANLGVTSGPLYLGFGPPFLWSSAAKTKRPGLCGSFFPLYTFARLLWDILRYPDWKTMHFLSSSNPVRLVLSPWRQLTEPRYRISQAHTMVHMHVHVTGIADSSKTHSAWMITDSYFCFRK